MGQQNEIAEIQQNLRAKGAESSKRMLGMLLGSQVEVLLKASISGWREVVVDQRFSRMIERNSKNRSKEEESQRRMLQMLLGSQESLVVKTTFAVWTDMYYEERK